MLIEFDYIDEDGKTRRVTRINPRTITAIEPVPDVRGADVPKACILFSDATGTPKKYYIDASVEDVTRYIDSCYESTLRRFSPRKGRR